MSQTFLYICGLDSDETELPAAVTVFGHKFIQDVPKTLDPSMFRTVFDYEHAVKKLSNHKHFRKLDDSVQEVIQPKKTWSRKKKVDVQDAIEVTDAAE
jgi:hypothetical protein